jgi:REP element-mobilizing transposase RayT
MTMNVDEQLLVQAQAQAATFSCCAPVTPQGTSIPLPPTRPWPSNRVATGSRPTRAFEDSPDCAPVIPPAKPWKPLPKQARFSLPHMPAHVLQRGQNRAPVFCAAQDYLEYLKILKRVAEACHCAIHAYILMTNRIHLLLTPEAGDSISRLFQNVVARTSGTSITPTIEAACYGKDATKGSSLNQPPIC